MKTKKEFIKELKVNREQNRIHLKDKIKKDYYTSDDDLAWKLYVAFPGHFNDKERLKLLKFITAHITQLACYALRSDIPKKEATVFIKGNLKDNFDIHLAEKTISKFINTILKIDRWNQI